MSGSMLTGWMSEKPGNRHGQYLTLEDMGEDPMLYENSDAKNLEVSKPRKFTEADKARIASEGPKKYSRDEHRKMKALEEARKMGTAPAEIDELGYEINPHIPHFVKTVPWYYDKDKKTTLQHQRHYWKSEQVKEKEMNLWYARGEESQVDNAKNKRWKKGSCSNCGATTVGLEFAKKWKIEKKSEKNGEKVKTDVFGAFQH